MRFVEVRFKNDRKSYYNNANNLPLHIGSVVTVESNPGHDIGVVSLTGELVKIQMKKKTSTKSFLLKYIEFLHKKM
jgi:cell fate regulator YaaT (PSP1 superfamily)